MKAKNATSFWRTSPTFATGTPRRLETNAAAIKEDAEVIRDSAEKATLVYVSWATQSD
jgi:hypothetical protein